MYARVIVRHQQVPIWGLPSEIDGLRIAQVSDLHFRGWGPVQARAQALLRELRYDLLTVTGDFSDETPWWRETAEWCRRFFAPLAPPLGTFAVLGNHDDRRLGHVTDLPFTWLNNQSVRLRHGDGALWVAGVRQDATDNGSVERALADITDGEPAILLAHYPSTAYTVPAGKVQITLAGHTHGGQIRTPLLGALWTNDRLPRRMARGLHLVGRNWLHVNPGIGTSTPIRARFLCPAEITLLVLCGVRTQLQSDHAKTTEVVASSDNRLPHAAARTHLTS